MPIVFAQPDPVSPEVSAMEGANEQNNIDLPRFLSQQQDIAQRYMQQRQMDQQDQHFYDQMDDQNADRQNQQDFLTRRDQAQADNRQKEMQAEFTFKDKQHKQQMEQAYADIDANPHLDDETRRDLKMQVSSKLSPLRAKQQAAEGAAKQQKLTAEAERMATQNLNIKTLQPHTIEMPNGGTMAFWPDMKGGLMHQYIPPEKEAKESVPDLAKFRKEAESRFDRMQKEYQQHKDYLLKKYGEEFTRLKEPAGGDHPNLIGIGTEIAKYDALLAGLTPEEKAAKVDAAVELRAKEFASARGKETSAPVGGRPAPGMAPSPSAPTPPPPAPPTMPPASSFGGWSGAAPGAPAAGPMPVPPPPPVAPTPFDHRPERWTPEQKAALEPVAGLKKTMEELGKTAKLAIPSLDAAVVLIKQFGTVAAMPPEEKKAYEAHMRNVINHIAIAKTKPEEAQPDAKRAVGTLKSAAERAASIPAS
jgi:hypothetical protein